MAKDYLLDTLSSRVSDTSFHFRLERYLDDYRKARKQPDAPVISSELFYRGQDNATELARTNIDSLRLYSGYLSGLSYTRSARFVSGVASAVRNPITTA